MTTTLADTDFREHAARRWEKRTRKWARPGDMAEEIDPAGTRQSPALRLIDRELALLADHQVPADSLAVFMSPQEGKSQRVARRFPEWLLAHNPALNIAIVSYERELATRWGRQILRDKKHAGDRLPFTVMADSSAAGRWDTPEGGGIYCVGIGGALTGRPVDCVSGDTRIECEYGQLTAAQAYLRGVRWIRAYDHATGRPGWRRVEAARRIRSRRVVEVTTTAGRILTCTPDHRVYTGRGYVPAGSLRPGDTLVALVAADRVPLRQPPGDRQGRGPQSDPPRPGALLLAGMHGRGVQRGEPDTVLRMRRAGSAAPAIDVFRPVPGPQPGPQPGEGQEPARSCATAAAPGPDMPAVRGAVHAQTQPAGVLRAGVRGRGALSPDDRAGQLALPDRDQLRALVPGDAPADHGTGPRPVRGLLADSRDRLQARRPVGLPDGADRPPHRRGRDGQPAGEPDHALRDVPCGTPQVEADTVAVVHAARGGPVDVYDFQVAGARNFFGGGLLVHNCLIIDDPLKGREEAESSVYRERAWDWFENVAIERMAPGGIMCLICTRWHTDDLAGRLMTRPGPRRWRVLSMPAIAEDRDVLGRAPGEEFPSIRGREPGYFANLRATMSSYVFSSVYQQNPVAAAGNFFRRQAFRYWRPMDGIDPAPMLRGGHIAGAWIDLEGARTDLTDCWRFATVDVAASTKTSADYTVVSVWAIDRFGNLILLDRARGHVETGDHFAMARPLRLKWMFDVMFVEKTFFSKTLVTDAAAAGIPVVEVVADTDKVTRAIPAAARLHAGKVWWPTYATAPWVETEWEPELLAFDKGNHDDQVDTLSYAARVQAAHWTPPPPAKRSRPQIAPSPSAERIALAYGAATGNGDHAPDLMTMPLG